MGSAVSETPSRLSEDQFLAWAEHRDGRFELIEGVVVMHAGATRDHERVAKRVFVALHARADEAAFDVNKGDFGVRIRPGRGQGTILYPDVVVDQQSGQGSERATLTPVVVVEVLSASTDYDDHVAKFAKYRVRPTLCQYVVFAQTEPKAFVWLKDEAGDWPQAPTVHEGLDAVVPFQAIEAVVSLSDVYRKPGP